jgi:hypothetical protein
MDARNITQTKNISYKAKKEVHNYGNASLSPTFKSRRSSGAKRPTTGCTI